MRFAVILIFVSLILGGIFILRDYKVPSDLKQPLALKLSPSPIPFYEMTIPYLRSREYEAKLGELQILSQNSNYTSYLTSYNSDNLKINGLLTKPTGEIPEGGWPAIIFIHGYIAPTQYETTTRYTDHVDYLAKNGFVVFKIDLFF